MSGANRKRLARLESRSSCGEFDHMNAEELRAFIASKIRALFPDETARYSDAEIVEIMKAAEQQSLSRHAGSNWIAGDELRAMLQGDIELRGQSADGRQLWGLRPRSA